MAQGPKFKVLVRKVKKPNNELYKAGNLNRDGPKPTPTRPA